MNRLRFGVLACAVCGLVGAFLPFSPFRGEEPSFYELMGKLGQPGQFYMTAVGYVLALTMALVATVKPPMVRWQGLVSVVGFGWVIVKLRAGFLNLITDEGVGANVMAISALAGVALAILCIAKPETAR